MFTLRGLMTGRNCSLVVPPPCAYVRQCRHAGLNEVIVLCNNGAMFPSSQEALPLGLSVHVYLHRCVFVIACKRSHRD